MDDHILGSHRSHGEILAKGMSAIRKLDEDSLLTIMKEFLGGDCFRVVEKEAGCGDVKDLARDFLLYGALAKFLEGKTDLTVVLEDQCTHSFHPLVFFQITP